MFPVAGGGEEGGQGGHGGYGGHGGHGGPGGFGAHQPVRGQAQQAGYMHTFSLQTYTT